MPVDDTVIMSARPGMVLHTLNVPMSPIYTTEPMATRALAAEIRHADHEITALLEQRFNLEQGTLNALIDVQCEAIEKIDVLLIYEGKGGRRHVGLEAKFDHQITVEQLNREAGEVDFLALLVIEVDDAVKHARLVDGIVTWNEVIDCFADSRLTIADVESMPLTKVRVERLLRQQGRPHERFPEGWDVSIRRGGSGIPAIEVKSPPLPDGRQIRGQIQVTGRRMPPTLDETYFEYHIGIQVNDADADLPAAAEVDDEPEWVPHLRTLERVLVDMGGESLRLSKHPASSGTSVRGKNKLPLVEKFLEGKSWLAKGYTDGWALGIRSTKTPAGELSELCEVAANIFLAWHRAETTNRVL